MFCEKCGTSLPDDASFCYKCGAKIGVQGGAIPASSPPTASTQQVVAPSGATSIKCPSCGAPIAPKFGEMVITCEYCGSSVTLGAEGWKSIQKHTMLPLKIPMKDDVIKRIHDLMDRGLLRRHLQESSTLQEINLTFVPYWIIPTSARTHIVAINAAAEVGTVATTAVLFGALSGMGSGRQGPGFGGGMLEGAMLGSMMGGGMGGGSVKKDYELDANYNFPIVALKALTDYQPHEYDFNLSERQLFDVSKIPSGIKVLNGDVSEESAKYEAKTLVDQLQSKKAHDEHHMVQQINTEEDVADGELLHVPVWAAKYMHKGNQIVLIIDGNSGGAIHSVGL